MTPCRRLVTAELDVLDAGRHDHRGLRRVVPDLVGQPQAVVAGHPDVAERHRGRPGRARAAAPRRRSRPSARRSRRWPASAPSARARPSRRRRSRTEASPVTASRKRCRFCACITMSLVQGPRHESAARNACSSRDNGDPCAAACVARTRGAARGALRRPPAPCVESRRRMMVSPRSSRSSRR